MRKSRSPAEVRSCLHLAHCSLQAAATWLQAHPVEYSSVMGTPATPADRHLPEYILLRRNDPAIDVALATYGRSRTVLTRLYDRASSALRAALAANASLFIGKFHNDRCPLLHRDRDRHLLWDIVRHAPLTELRALCSNPNISSGFYGALIEIWKPDGSSDISEERFQHIVAFLAENPRIAQSREESEERHYLDGYADYTYNKLYVGAWKLAATVPVTASWAETLALLYRRLHGPYNCLDDVNAVIARWHGEVGEFEPDYYRDVRTQLCAAFVEPTIEELRSDDPARRDAFLMTFNPDAPEFRDLDWNEFMALDRHWNISLNPNMKVWASAKARQTYRQLLWKASKVDNDITAIGFFDEQQERLQRAHPEWFIEDPLDEHQSASEPDKIDRLRSEIRQLIEIMGDQRNTVVGGAALLIAGLVIGHFL